MRRGVMGELVITALIVASQAIMVYILVSTLWRVDRKIKVLQERTDELWFFMNLHKGMLNGIMDRGYR